MMELEEVIDVTDLVGNMQDTFVRWAVAFVYADLAVQFPFLAIPGVKQFFEFIIELVCTRLAKSAVMQAFFVNTAIRKASQAQDYILALVVRKNLSSTASEEEYEHAERNELAAFNSFVRITN